MSKRYKGIIFDLDGTLLNTLEDLADSVNFVLEKKGFSGHSLDAYRFYVGNGARNLIIHSLPSPEKENIMLVDACLDLFKAYYHEHMTQKTKPYTGILSLLTSLNQMSIPMAICSNKPDSLTKILVETYFSAFPFVACYGEQPGFKRKPNPEVVWDLEKKLNLKREEIILVGDSKTDIETAINAQMLPVGVSWGFRPRQELEAAGAKFILDFPKEIWDILAIEA